MRSNEHLAQSMQYGLVYRREDLMVLSKAVDRDLADLVGSGTVKKVAPGLYHKPKLSRFGDLPPDDNQLVKSFLRDHVFMLYSWNDYTRLQLGLTQHYNRMVVYNRKRHGVFKLGNKEFDFRRPARGFPKKITAEFLLVDLVNNIKELDEDSEKLKAHIKTKLDKFNKRKLMHHARTYGKIATLKFFKELCN